MHTLVYLLNLMAALHMPAPHVDTMQLDYVDSQTVGCPIWFVDSEDPSEAVVVCQGAQRLVVITSSQQ